MGAAEPVAGGVLKALAELVAGFDTFAVRYALIGGLATGLRSRPRATLDVDILLAVPQIQLPGLLGDLASRGFTIDENAVIDGYVRHHITLFEYHGVRIDWLKPVLPLYQHVLDRAETVEGFGRPVRVASAEGLILLKLIAARDQDWGDIASLLAANRGRLDLDWVADEWQTLFTTGDPRWLRFQTAIGEYYMPR